MGGSEFDIYEGPHGVTAVANPVQRQILLLLADRDRSMTEIAKETGKSKPTLSNLHLKELQAKGLLEQFVHPTDKRKAVYRLTATSVGSSDVPFEQLRGLVEGYAAKRMKSIPVTFGGLTYKVLRLSPDEIRDELLGRQAIPLGHYLSQHAEPPTSPPYLQEWALILERAGIGQIVSFVAQPPELHIRPVGEPASSRDVALLQTIVDVCQTEWCLPGLDVRLDETQLVVSPRPSA